MDEITSLKAENERFKAIIDILLKENKQLRAAIACHSGDDGKDRHPNAYHPGDDRHWGKEHSYLATDDGNDRSNNSDLHSDDRHWEKDHSYLMPDDRKDLNNISYLPNDDRNDMPNVSYHLVNDGNKKIDHSLMIPYLRTEMRRSKTPGLKNAAVLLGHFYNHPQNTYKHLAAITHMTKSGLAKHLHMLKKRGLIKRIGFQTHALTPKALGIVEKGLQVAGDDK